MSAVVASLVVSVLLLLAFCAALSRRRRGAAPGPGRGRGLGASPAGGGPCPGGTVCAGGLCVPCGTDHLCPEGLVCQAGACSLCGPSVPCPAGLLCDGGLCVPCDAAHPCPGGLVCDGGLCVPCDVAHPCPGGWVCVGGRCVPACVPCDDDAQACPAGQVCARGTCVAAPGCDPKTPCPAGLTCGTDGKCAACYVWRAWDPSASPQAYPPDLFGAGDSPLAAGGRIAPVAVAPSGRTDIELGFIDQGGAFTANTSGGRGPPTPQTPVYYLAAPASCPPPASVADPARAAAFRGVPACMDLQRRGMLFPYAGGHCATSGEAGYAPQLLGLPA